MSKAKKPTPAQNKIMQQMNEDICILNRKYFSIDLWIRLYDYKKSRGIGTTITKKTLEMLIFYEWVKIDHSKNTDSNFYYFITEKGKQALNEQNKEA